MTEKNIRLVTSRPVNEYHTTVAPGETFSELLEKNGLKVNEYIALKPTDKTEFLPGDEVYPHVGDGSKLHLTMYSDVGAQWGRRFAAPVRTYAQDQGWTKSRLPNGALQHSGYFFAARRRWWGTVVENGGALAFYILDPPIGIIRGTKWEGCFHAISREGLYAVTFLPRSQPREVDGGILAINKVLQTCFRYATWRRR